MNLIHLSISITVPHQSEVPFVGEQVFQNHGVCHSLTAPPPPCSFPFFALAPIFARPESSLARDTLHFAHMGKLATQAIFSWKATSIVIHKYRICQKNWFHGNYLSLFFLKNYITAHSLPKRKLHKIHLSIQQH